MADSEADIRRVPIPSHRYNHLRSNWAKITAPIVEQLKLQIRSVSFVHKLFQWPQFRFNLKTRRVEIRCPEEQSANLTYLQKAEDFVRAFSLGFDVDDSLALIRLDHIFLESFEVTDGERDSRR